MTEKDFSLSTQFRDNLEELVQMLRHSRGKGGLFLTGISGPVAQQSLFDGLQKKLGKEFLIKQIHWRPNIKELNELFPDTDDDRTIYFVVNLGESLQEDKISNTCALLNLTREFYVTHKRIVIYIIPSEPLYKVIQWKAPDFWSFRTASYDFYQHEDFAVQIRKQVEAELQGYEKETDKIAYLEELLSFERKKENPDLMKIGELLTKLGISYDKIGDIQKALIIQQEALKISIAIGYKKGKSITLGNIASIYSEINQLSEAKKYLQQSLEIAREIGDKKLETQALGDLGGLVYSNGNHQNAIELLKQALKINRELKNSFGEALNLSNIGFIYLENARLQEALEYIQQSLNILHSLGDKSSAITPLGHIGEIYLKMEKPQTALTYFQKALEYAKKLGLKPSEARQLNNLGRTFLKSGQPDKALVYLKNALTIYKQLDNQPWIEETQELIQQATEEMKIH